MRNRLSHIPPGCGGSNADSPNKRGKKRRCHSTHEDNEDGDEDNAIIFQWNNAPAGVINPQFCPYYLKEPHHKDFAEKGKLYKSCRLKHIPKLLQHIRRTHTKPEQCGRCGFRGDAGQVKEHKAKITKCEKKPFEGVSEEDLRIEEVLKSSKQGLSSSELFKAIFGSSSSPDYDYARNYEACEKALPALSEIFQEYSRQNWDTVWRVACCFRGFPLFREFSKKHPDANFDALGVKFWIERHVLNLFASITEPSETIASDFPASTQSATDYSASNSQTPYQVQTLQNSASCSLTPQSLAINATNNPSILKEPQNYQPVSHFGSDINQSLSSPILPQDRRDSNSSYYSINEHPRDTNYPPSLQMATQHQENQPDCNNLQVTQSSMGVQLSHQADNNPSPPGLYENDQLNADLSLLSHPSPETVPHRLHEDERRATPAAPNARKYSHTSDSWPSSLRNYFPTADYNQTNGMGSQFEAISGPTNIPHAHLVKHPLPQGHQTHNLAGNGHIPNINLHFAAPQFHFNNDHSICDNSFGAEYYSSESSLSTPQSEVTCREPESLEDTGRMQVESSPTHWHSWG